MTAMPLQTLAVDELGRRFSGISCIVGNRALLAIDCSCRSEPRTAYAEAENLDLTGSIKDRMAMHILRLAYERGVLEPGGTIIGATPGNTGIAVAAVGSVLGHPVTIFMPDWMSRERIALIGSFGADITLVSKE